MNASYFEKEELKLGSTSMGRNSFSGVHQVFLHCCKNNFSLGSNDMPMSCKLIM